MKKNEKTALEYLSKFFHKAEDKPQDYKRVVFLGNYGIETDSALGKQDWDMMQEEGIKVWIYEKDLEKIFNKIDKEILK